jgi:hypothetical protein
MLEEDAFSIRESILFALSSSTGAAEFDYFILRLRSEGPNLSMRSSRP